MSVDFETADGPWHAPTEHGSAADRLPPILLESVVVRYDGEPDRCTVYDPETSGFERTTTWLTADQNCFVDLADAR